MSVSVSVIKTTLREQLAEALRIVREEKRLVFADVMVDEKEHVYPMQIRNGGMDEICG